jgi:hypothetical protein
MARWRQINPLNTRQACATASRLTRPWRSMDRFRCKCGMGVIGRLKVYTNRGPGIIFVPRALAARRRSLY